jgi:hypothetical protein
VRVTVSDCQSDAGDDTGLDWSVIWHSSGGFISLPERRDQRSFLVMSLESLTARSIDGIGSHYPTNLGAIKGL